MKYVNITFLNMDLQSLDLRFRKIGIISETPTQVYNVITGKIQK